MAEEARVEIRRYRHEGNDRIKKMFKDKSISEDDERRGLEESQKLTDKKIKEVDDLLKVEGAGDPGGLSGRMATAFSIVRGRGQRAARSRPRRAEGSRSSLRAARCSPGRSTSFAAVPSTGSVVAAPPDRVGDFAERRRRRAATSSPGAPRAPLPCAGRRRPWRPRTTTRLHPRRGPPSRHGRRDPERCWPRPRRSGRRDRRDPGRRHDQASSRRTASSHRRPRRRSAAAATPQAFRADAPPPGPRDRAEKRPTRRRCASCWGFRSRSCRSRAGLQDHDAGGSGAGGGVLRAREGREADGTARGARLRRASVRGRPRRCAWEASRSRTTSGLEGHSDGDALLHALTRRDARRGRRRVDRRSLPAERSARGRAPTARRFLGRRARARARERDSRSATSTPSSSPRRRSIAPHVPRDPRPHRRDPGRRRSKPSASAARAPTAWASRAAATASPRWRSSLLTRQVVILSRLHPIEEAVARPPARDRMGALRLGAPRPPDQRAQDALPCERRGGPPREPRRPWTERPGPAHQGAVARLAVRGYLEEEAAWRGTPGSRFLLRAGRGPGPPESRGRPPGGGGPRGRGGRARTGFGAALGGRRPSSAGAVERVPVVRAKNLRRFHRSP